MNLIDDFFILIWGEKSSEKLSQKAQKLSHELVEKLAQNRELFCEASAVVLSVNFQNFDKFSDLEAFSKIASFFDFTCKEILHVKILQIAILNSINQQSITNNISLHVKTLFGENIINEDTKNKILSLLDLTKNSTKTKEAKTPKKATEPKSYKEYTTHYENIIKNLNQILESQNLINQINSLHVKLKNQTFSIGVTGVMNAGKSTMLNALLGKEVLGTSVVPETANLTIIKHSKKPYAKVNFWNKNEWQSIEKSAPFMPSIAKFVEQTKENFGDKIKDYITDKGRVVDIDIDMLSSYTSAKHSNLKCNLVKSVELCENLDFVKNGVNIVDTPGLDDPVIQREEITKKYLSDCDVMIHLMNVNQSATKKDVDFIIDSLTYGHISRLLVVITRIDTVSKDELNEVIAYTKKSIKLRLIDENKEAKFDYIISKIDFLPIAGKLALMHRIGKKDEALKLGYDLKDTGILQIEDYLKEVLFGKENEKNILFLQSISKEMLIIIDQANKRFLDEKSSLQKSSSELKIELRDTKKLNEQNLKTIEKIESQIDEAKNSLNRYFETLANFINGKLSLLKNITTQRVCDDVSYEWRKNKKKPKNERIQSMIETTMKDGIVDTIRDYRYEFAKRMDNELEQISMIDKDLFNNDEKSIFDAKEYFEQNFGTNFLNSSYAVTNQRVFESLQKVKKGKIDTFSMNLDQIFKETIENLSTTIFASLKEINRNLLDGFIAKVNKPINDLKESMKEQEESLKSQILLLQSGEDKAKNRLHVIDEKILTLSDIQKNIKGTIL